MKNKSLPSLFCYLLAIVAIPTAVFCFNRTSQGAGFDLPDHRITPGITNPAVTDPCNTKWGQDVRHVTLSMKKQVFASYKIPWSEHSKYEVDHLISRELGGADDVRNLWPQHWSRPNGAHEKDQLENRLHVMVCSGQITLAQAQKEISTNWLAAYQKYVVQKKK